MNQSSVSHVCCVRPICVLRSSWADDFLASNPQFAGEVSRLKGLLSGDYAAEADALCAKTDAADGKTDKEQ